MVYSDQSTRQSRELDKVVDRMVNLLADERITLNELDTIVNDLFPRAIKKRASLIRGKQIFTSE